MSAVRVESQPAGTGPHHLPQSAEVREERGVDAPRLELPTLPDVQKLATEHRIHNEQRSYLEPCSVTRLSVCI